MIRVAKIITGTCVAAIVLLCFCAAAVIEPGPRVRPTVPPDAGDVRAAVDFYPVVIALANAPEPMPFTLTRTWIESIHRLVGHAKDNIGVDGHVDEKSATFLLSKRLMRHGWLNLAFRLETVEGGGTPLLKLYAGEWKAPAPLTAVFLRVVPKLLGTDQKFSDLLTAFNVENDSVRLTGRVPKEVIGGLQAVLGSGDSARMDMAHVRTIYGNLLAFRLRHPEVDYAAVIRQAAGQAHNADDLRATIIALTLFVDGPRVRRLVGEKSRTPPCPLEPETVSLHGRTDSPKHWTLSAALALLMKGKTARAAGLWKELDDSLPGGSGFSFVDLAADMGGVKLGIAARSGRDSDRVLAMLRTANAGLILPRPTLALPEAMPNAEWSRRYGPIERPRMLQAETRINALLDQSALYRLLPDNRP